MSNEDAVIDAPRSTSRGRMSTISNPVPQVAPGSDAAIGHTLENSIPLSIFPIATEKFVVCFCGLPGRGKTHISRRLARYLSFFHAVPVELFNIGEYRRKMYGGMKDASWFDSANEESANCRRLCNLKAMEDMTIFLSQHSNGIAIYDSTTSTYERRALLIEIMKPSGAKVLFVEVQNDNPEFLSDQISDVALTSPDYKGVSNEKALEDYRQRLQQFEKMFETLGLRSAENNWSYLQCNHHTQHFVVHKVKGYLPLKIVHFIMNLRTTKHAFYLSRHGQSEYNEVGRIGGDSGLTFHGKQYGMKLAEFAKNVICRDEQGNEIPGRLWTSTMRRTKETASYIEQNVLEIPDDTDPSRVYEWVQMKPRAWHHLDEIFAGVCDGMTYEEIEEHFPEEFELRKVDKLAYRYPRGESYLDVIARIEPIVLEMERHREPLLIVGHQGILRIIYAFYMGLTRAESPYVSIPLNSIVQLVPSAFDCMEKRFTLYTPPKDLPSDGQGEPHPPTPTESLAAIRGLTHRGKSTKFMIADANDPPSH